MSTTQAALPSQLHLAAASCNVKEDLHIVVARIGSVYPVHADGRAHTVSNRRHVNVGDAVLKKGTMR